MTDNCSTAFFDKIVEIVRGNGSKDVIWCGLHPLNAHIYSLMIELGVEKYSVVDNDLFKQGIEIADFKAFFTRDDRHIIVSKKLQKEMISNNTIFLLANSHYDEICEQLRELGVNRDRIYNLFPMMNDYKVLHDARIDECESYNLLSGRSLQMVYLEALKAFREICENYNLRYCIAAGTLIGAVRHMGFIPWDDDVDVYMPDSDYQKFLEIAPRSGKYYVADWRSDSEYFQPYARLMDRDTLLFEEFLGVGSVRSKVFVDIFPISGFDGNNEERIKRLEELQLNRHNWYYYYLFKDLQNLEIHDCREELESEWFICSFDEAQYVGAIHPGAKMAWTTRKDAFDGFTKVVFEGETFNAPIGWDDYLKARYGQGYMKSPLIKDRVTHHYPTFSLI